MIQDIFYKKENIFILIITCVSIFFVVLGFLFLFFKEDSNSKIKIIPNSINDIVWNEYQSKILHSKILYPNYLFVFEQNKQDGVGIHFTDIESKSFLTYFSNQNHISFYPEGLDTKLFYGKTNKSEYKNNEGKIYDRIEYVTQNNVVWGVMLIPQKTPENWHKNGFIWIQSEIKHQENYCIKNNVLKKQDICDPYGDEFLIYSGVADQKFIDFGYEVINKNLF